MEADQVRFHPQLSSEFGGKYFSFAANEEGGGIWQRRFWEHMIRDEADLNVHRDYIHYNPVKHGLVDSPGKWEHSSFKAFLGKGFYAEDWGKVPRKELTEMDLE